MQYLRLVQCSNTQVGDDIAIASTSFVPDQAEKRTITKVEGHVLTLDQALEFDHDYLLQTVNVRQFFVNFIKPNLNQQTHICSAAP